MRDPSLISALDADLEHNPRMQVQAVQERIRPAAKNSVDLAERRRLNPRLGV
jgi:hypothetical protein